tara:strand:- start:6253 stop:7164 length:912 start_codon:yes stop_codon:yes gene_type:complete
MKNNYIFKFKTSFVLLFCMVMHYSTIAQTMETINVSADTYVRGGSQADDNYGSEAEILARDTTTSAARIVYFKFPVSNALPNSVTNATLKFFSRINSSSTSTEFLEVHKLVSSWDESSVTWNTKPATGAFITDNLAVPVGPTNPAPYTEVSQDVTDYFNEVLAASGTEISFAIKALPSDAGGDGRAVRIGTKEDSNPTAATIEINYTLGVDYFSSNNGSPLKIYPNPIKSEFTLNKSFNTSDSLEISIFNFLGQKISGFSENVQPGNWEKTYNKADINMKNGIYLIKVTSTNHGESFSKIVVD